MERLKKKELRTLLECIKECYPICDLETFTQRLVSRLAKIVPTEIFSHNGMNPHKRRDTCATYPARACSPSVNKILQQRVNGHRVLTCDEKPSDTRRLNLTDFPTARQFRPTGITQQLLSALGAKYPIASRIIKPAASSKGKDFTVRDQLLFKLLSEQALERLQF